MFPVSSTPAPTNPNASPFAPPPPTPAEKIAKQDDDIFNRARLINCVYFTNAILGDYLSGILGTFRDANDWYLNPLEEIREGGVTKVNRAEGNSVSVEFNLLYRVSVLFLFYSFFYPLAASN
jgi:linoleate 10R-lipoxygenase